MGTAKDFVVDLARPWQLLDTTAEAFLVGMAQLGHSQEMSLVGSFEAPDDTTKRTAHRDIDLPFHRDGIYTQSGHGKVLVPPPAAKRSASYVEGGPIVRDGFSHPFWPHPTNPVHCATQYEHAGRCGQLESDVIHVRPDEAWRR